MSRTHLLRSAARTCILLASDLALLALAQQAIYWIRGSAALGGFASRLAAELAPPGGFPRARLATALLLGLVVFGNYGPGDRRRNTPKLFAAAALATALVYWNRLWIDFDVVSTFGAFLVALVLGGALALERHIVDALVRYFRPQQHALKAIVIGFEASAQYVLHDPAIREEAGFTLAGFVDVAPTASPDALGGISDLIEIIERHQIDTVVFADQLDESLFIDLLHAADGAGCYVFSLSRPYLPPGGFTPEIVRRAGVPLVQLTRPGMRASQMALKRMFDILLASVGLVILAPVFAAVALMIRATTPGPVIFRQRRVGLGGRPFDMYKFRSMVLDAEDRRCELASESVYSDGRLFKIEKDPRVTRLGMFLRRSSLDELPQFFNVLLGHMSMVGPRPPLPSEVTLYEEHHYTRFAMKPGITGPWQVNGRSRVRDFEEVIRLETEYLRNWGLWKDFDILVKTLPTVMKMSGAV